MLCKNSFLLVFILLSSKFSVAQSSFVPQKLPVAVNSTWDEIRPILSPDGKTLYFTRVNHPENRSGEKDSQDIWSSTKQTDGTWSSAVNLTALNRSRYNAVLGTSADGKSLLLNGVYNKRGNFWKKRGLSISTQTGKEWSTPKALKIKKLAKKNRGLTSSASISNDGNTLILSYSKRYDGKRSNLFISQKKENGKWRKPKKLKALNSRSSEEAPFLLADSKTLYFACDCKKKGNFDLYRSTRLSDDFKKWSSPKALSDTVNSSGWESYLSTNIKGSYAYFSSTKGTPGDADILTYKVFEENPFVVVSGNLFNATSKRLLKGKQLSLLVDGKPFNGAHISSDSATYTLTLPLRKKYQLAVAAPYYTSIPETIDVSTTREFTKMQQDLTVSPHPFALVRGKLLVSNTTTNIPAYAKPAVWINGKKADSVLVNAQEGTYIVNLKHGATYSMQVKADRFESITETLDLTDVDEYQEVTKNLYAEADKMATLTGRIIDKKTNSVIATLQDVTLNVEGLDTARAVIDDAGQYLVRLPLGKVYTVSASAPNYYPVYEVVDVSQENGDVKVLKDLIIVPIEVGQSIRLNNIFFESGKSILKKESFPELDRVTEFLVNSPDIKIEIAGHTDNVGKVATNQKLSLERAKAVAAYVVKLGIDKNRIVAKGYGSSKPVADNKTKEGKAQNRRVEFTILDK